MEVKNCRMCRRLFNYLGGPNICPECKDELERKFIKVRNYIQDTPGATMQEISDVNEVSVNQIRDWIREGRLEMMKGSPIKLTCEQCGADILTGRFCDNCKKNMASGLSEAFKKDAPIPTSTKSDNHSNKMRFRR